MTVPTYPDSPYQRWIVSFLVDPRDAALLRLAVKAVLVMVPLIALVYWHFTWWTVALLWTVQFGVLLAPVILMVHATMHRPFIREPRWLNHAIPWTMSALFGIPTGFQEHHIGMHHQENNLPDADLSSTASYKRDSLLHWLHYFGRFLLTVHTELPQYLVENDRDRLARRASLTNAAQMAFVVAMTLLDWKAGLVAFAIPWLVTRAAMLWGNWGQHAFIDPRRPGDSYVNSITCINSRYNQQAWNDGYHIGHHVKQNRHWAELPQDFLDNVERYGREGCIVFEGIDFFMVSAYLFLGRYDWLAEAFVRMPGDQRSAEEIAAFLRSRTQPLDLSAVETSSVLNAA